MPKKRPAIPAETVRQVFIETGHRCAVCGTGLPLERAHIIPWHESQDNSAENLICLCANCHERADLEGWGEQTLREYKERPWIMRNYEKADPMPTSTTQLRLTVDLEYDQFDDRQKHWLQYALASFLNTAPDHIQIVSVEPGSVIVAIKLPTPAASALLTAFVQGNPALAHHLAPLRILKPGPLPESTPYLLTIPDGEVIPAAACGSNLLRSTSVPHIRRDPTKRLIKRIEVTSEQGTFVFRRRITDSVVEPLATWLPKEDEEPRGLRAAARALVRLIQRAVKHIPIIGVSSQEKAITSAPTSRGSYDAWEPADAYRDSYEGMEQGLAYRDDPGQEEPEAELDEGSIDE